MDRDDAAALAAHAEALDGVTLAHTSLLAALMNVLRAKGVVSQVETNAIFDSALTAAEVAPAISPEATRRARRILELIAAELAGPRQPDR